MNPTIKSTLASLHRGQHVTVTYDGKFEQQRLQVTGKIEIVDHFWETLQVNNVGIDFSEIHDIEF